MKHPTPFLILIVLWSEVVAGLTVGTLVARAPEH